LSAAPTTKIRKIARVMLDEYVSEIPIIDRSRHPIGILTAGDMLRTIVR